MILVNYSAIIIRVHDFRDSKRRPVWARVTRVMDQKDLQGVSPRHQMAEAEDQSEAW